VDSNAALELTLRAKVSSPAALPLRHKADFQDTARMDSTQTIVTDHPIISTYKWHQSFERHDAASIYDPRLPLPELEEGRSFHHADDQKAIAKRMHYAAFSWSNADTDSSRVAWNKAFFLARNRLCVTSLGIAHFVADRFPYKQKHRFDLLAVSQAELVEAIPAFDPWRGPPLSTWLTTCLRNRCLEILRRGDRHRCGRGSEILLQQLPTLSAPERPERDQLDQLLGAADGILSSVEKNHLVQRFGLSDGEPMSERELARRFECSQQNVNRVLKRTLGKLRAIAATRFPGRPLFNAKNSSFRIRK